MIRHLMLVKTKPTVTNEQLEHTKQAFLNAPTIFSGLKSVEWGLNNSPEHKNMGYEICILMTFADAESRDAFLPHPDHDKLKKIFVPIIEDIIVFDYER